MLRLYTVTRLPLWQDARKIPLVRETAPTSDSYATKAVVTSGASWRQLDSQLK